MNSIARKALAGTYAPIERSEIKAHERRRRFKPAMS